MHSKFNPFFPRQSPKSRGKYIKLIRAMAQLSRIHTSSEKPYLGYRVAENIFCNAFSADNETRKDLSVDAVKIKDGIGIKTFVTGGSTSKHEKIAEFVDREKYPLDEGNIPKMVGQVAEYRNKRLIDTIKEFDLTNTIYHYLARDEGKIYICECPMFLIDLSSIEIESDKPKGNLIKFEDKFFNYKFHLSKHTLFKKFHYDDPFVTLEISKKLNSELLIWALHELDETVSSQKPLLEKYDYVLLPLYSTVTGEVPEKSGLNQWNAGGRKRGKDELYIPIPISVHRKKPGFFPPRNKKFILKTEDEEKFSAKVCQDNDKALMSDPNKDLGKWLLRNKLGFPEGKIVTYNDLKEKNVDTVIVYKISSSEFKISLHSFGSFESE